MKIVHLWKVRISCRRWQYVIALIILSLSCVKFIYAEKNTSYIYPPWRHTWGVVRATPFKLRLFLGNKTKFNDPQGLACVRLLSWEDTTTTADDDEITVYGVNSGDNCIVYNRSMYSLGIYGLEDDHVKFNRPWGVAADESGNVYVVDRGNSRVVHLKNSGKNLEFSSFIGEHGDSPGKFIDPRGVALDSEGNLYVTDAATGIVSVFDINGNVAQSWNGFIEPDGISIIGPNENWSYRKRNSFIIVIDSLHQRINKVNFEGKIIASKTPNHGFNEEPYFGFVEIDYHSQVLITDRNNGCFHKYSADLDYITSFGENGHKDYQFDQPRGICNYRHFGQTFVLERAGAQYLWVAVDVNYLKAKVRTDFQYRDLEIDFELTEPALCQIDILDNYGRLIAKVINNLRYPAGKTHLSWALKIPARNSINYSTEQLPPQYKKGSPFPPGDYVVMGRFKAVYSSREHFEREIKANFTIE